MNINERVKQVRLVTGLSQASFAERIGITQNKIARIETSKIAPHPSILNNICFFFDVSQDWLINGDGHIFVDGSDIYKKISVPKLVSNNADSLFEAIVIEVDKLLSSMPTPIKAKVMRYYFEHYSKTSEDLSKVKKEIGDSIKFVTEFVGGS